MCVRAYIDDIIYGLDIGAFFTLGSSKYVLAELYSNGKPSEALEIIKALMSDLHSLFSLYWIFIENYSEKKWLYKLRNKQEKRY